MRTWRTGFVTGRWEWEEERQKRRAAYIGSRVYLRVSVQHNGYRFYISMSFNGYWLIHTLTLISLKYNSVSNQITYSIQVFSHQSSVEDGLNKPCALPAACLRPANCERIGFPELSKFQNEGPCRKLSRWVKPFEFPRHLYIAKNYSLRTTVWCKPHDRNLASLCWHYTTMWQTDDRQTDRQTDSTIITLSRVYLIYSSLFTIR